MWSLTWRESIFTMTHFVRSSADRHQDVEFALSGRDKTRRNERLKNHDELNIFSMNWNHQTKTSSLRLLSYSHIHTTTKSTVGMRSSLYERMIVNTNPKKIEVFEFEFTINVDQDCFLSRKSIYHPRKGPVTSISTKKSRSRRSERGVSRTVSHTMSSKRFSVTTFLNEKEA